MKGGSVPAHVPDLNDAVDEESAPTGEQKLDFVLMSKANQVSLLLGENARRAIERFKTMSKANQVSLHFMERTPEGR